MSDTVAAVATAPGEGAIGIVRLSGPAAFAIADRVFRGGGGRSLSEVPPFRLVLGAFVDPGTGDEIDEVLAVRMPEGRSYTKECVVEFQSHGGRAVLEAILACVVDCGARCAEPGEFTRRAFLNGRIDLAQAEAVAELIRAESEAERRGALRRLQGAAGQEVSVLRDRLLDVVAEAEAALDFGEEEGIGETFHGPMLERVAALARDLAERSRCGRRTGEGTRVALVGRPNSGKSSLFNMLIDRERSIVTADPGTTRDYIEERAVLAGASMILIDTAGIRQPLDAAEGEGVRRSWDRIRDADILVLLIDGSEPLHDEDGALALAIAGQSPLVVISKCDLPARIDLAGVAAACAGSIFRLSARTGEGCQAFATALASRQRSLLDENPSAATALNFRQRESLERTVSHLNLACEHASGAQPPLDQIILDLREALAALGEITGETATDAILDRVFSRFCLGK